MQELTERQIRASIAYLDPDLDSIDDVHEHSSVEGHDALALALVSLVLSSGFLGFVLLYLHIF